MTTANDSTGLTDDEIATITQTNLSASQGWESDELATNMRDALDYYLGRKPSQTFEGASDVVSMDVADMVEAVLANMVPSITSDSVVSFNAEGEDDESQADMESDAVNIMIHDRNNGFTLFLEAIKNALLLKTGIIKCFVEESTDTSTDEFVGLSDIEFASVALPEDRLVSAEVVESHETDDGINATIRYTTTRQELKLSAVLPEQFSVYANYNKLRLTKCPFTAERHTLRRSELVEMGFPAEKVNELPATADNQLASVSRNIGETQPPKEPGDHSQETVEVYQCFETLDVDGDGIGELLEVWIGGTGPTILLSKEPVDIVPYAIGSPFINPGRWLGYSLFDRIAQVQDVKTEGLRQWLDGAANANIPRTEAVVGQVNMDDLADKRSSGVVRVKAPGMTREMGVTDIGPSMMSLLQYQDKVRGERGGASLDLQSGEAQLVGSSIGSQGVDRIYSSKEQLAGLMTRTLGETLIRQTYLLVHATMRSQMTGRVAFKKAGDWVETDPRTWPARTRLNVMIGASPNERSRRSGNLQQVIQLQTQAMQAGMDGVLVDLPGMYAAVKDWARSAEIDVPEQYFIDPRSQQAQQAQEQKAKQAQEAQQRAEQQQQQILLLQVQLQQAQISSSDWQTLMELQFKYFDATLKSEVEEAKLIQDAMSEQLQRMQGIGSSQIAGLGGAANSAAGNGAGV